MEEEYTYEITDIETCLARLRKQRNVDGRVNYFRVRIGVVDVVLVDWETMGAMERVLMLMHRALPALPHWVAMVSCRYTPDEAHASCTSECAYRRLRVWFGADWVASDLDHQWETVLHEVCHAHLGPLDSWLEEVVWSSLPEALQGAWQVEKRRYKEQVTCDLEAVFSRLL